MLKKSNRITLEEATRLAILGKLPLKENKEIKKESTTVTTTPDGLTAVETDDANIVIEPKDNAAVDIGMGTEVCDGPECVDEPVADLPAEEPIDEPIDEPVEDEFEESKKFEGKEPKRKVISKHDIKKVESKNKGLKEHKIAFKASNKLQEGVYAVEYIGSFNELYESSWGQAVKILDEIAEADKEEELMDYLEEFGYDEQNAIGRTELNDLLAFDWETVFEALGISEDEDEDLDESKKVEGKKVEEGNAQLFQKKINKTDIKKVENKEKKTEGEAPLFKQRISKADIKKVENKVKKEEAEKAKKRNVINKVDLRKTESKKDLNKALKTKVAEGLTKFVKESYKNGKEIKVEKLLNLTENKLYVKGKLVMKNCTKDFTCKLVPVKENKSFRRYTIQENKLLKITEGKTVKGKSFSLIVKK